MGDILVFGGVLYVAAAVSLIWLLPHFGINPLWTIFTILPVGFVILLWVMVAKSREETT